MSPSVIEIDRRKARIVASLRPTRGKRHLSSQDLASQLGVKDGTIYRWENGETIVPDEQMAKVEAWLAEGPGVAIHCHRSYRRSGSVARAPRDTRAGAQDDGRNGPRNANGDRVGYLYPILT